MSRQVILQEIKHKPNEKLVENLQELLEDAKSGKLHSCFIVCQWHGDWYSHRWSHVDNVKTMSVLGQFRVMEHKLINNWGLVNK